MNVALYLWTICLFFFFFFHYHSYIVLVFKSVFQAILLLTSNLLLFSNDHKAYLELTVKTQNTDHCNNYEQWFLKKLYFAFFI